MPRRQLDLLSPQKIATILIISAMFFSGIMLFGVCLLDEFFLTASAILFAKIFFAPFKNKNLLTLNFHELFFVLLILFLFSNSVYGFIYWSSWRIIRWPVMFISLLPTIFLFRHRHINQMSHRLLLIVTSLYLFCYLCQGFIAEQFIQISRFDTQGKWWSGSAYAVFISILGLPLSIKYIKDNYRTKSDLLLPALTIILTMLVSKYYQSRLLSLIIITYNVLAFFKIGWKKSILIMISYMLICYVGQGTTAREDILSIINRPNSKNISKMLTNFTLLKNTSFDLETQISAATFNRPTDYDRRNMLLALVSAMSFRTNAWGEIILGRGCYSHHFQLGKYLEPLNSKDGLPPPKSDMLRVSALAAFVFDFGLIGVLLLLVNLALVIHSFWQKKEKIPIIDRILLSSVPILACGWLTVSNILDVVLFYIIISPSGLIYIWKNRNTTERSTSFLV